MKNNNQDLLIFGIVGGTSASKTTQAQLLLDRQSHILTFSISGTTRPLTDEEQHGKDYFRFTMDEFLKMEEEGKFLETNPYANGNRYGTLRSELERAISEHKILLLDMEINGAKQIHDLYPDNSEFVFLDVEDKEAIIRLQKSGTRKRDNIPQRIANLQEQRKLALEYEWIKLFIDTTGSKIETVYQSIEQKLLSEIRCRRSIKHYQS